MSEPKSHNLAEIEGLLASRQQLMGWLERLDDAGSRAPEAVRAKVRSDYQGRLALVVTQLSTHGDLIGSTLDGLRAQVRQLRQLRLEEREVRAEAELRHSVGEYSDDEWQLVELESSGKIEELDQELERLGGEAQRLEEVQALIGKEERKQEDREAPEPEPEPAATREPEVVQLPAAAPLVSRFPSYQLEEPQPALALHRDEEPEAIVPQPRPEAPRFVPRGGGPKQRESGPARTPPTPSHAPHAANGPQDELAFLRSVTLDPASTRLTPQNTGAPPTLDREERPSGALPKTLKCAECGSLNRPTEWYCERCGAELAAL